MSSQLLTEALALHQQGRLVDALARYEAILRENPRHVDALHLSGVVALQQGRHDAAVASIRAAIEIKPNQAVFHGNLGVALDARGERAAAAEALQRAVELKPDYLDAWRQLVRVLVALRRWDEAAATVQRGLTSASGAVVGELQGLLGFVRQEQGRVDEAIAALRQAVVANPRQYDALTRLAQLLVTAGKVGEAVDIFRQAVALRPAQAGAHSNLANALHLHGQAEEAMAEYRRAIELDPRFVGAHVNLGLALSQVGRPDEALPILERALELQPNNAEAWNNLGGVYSALGRTRDCEQAFRRALELRPDYPEAWNNLGNALHSQLRLDEAASCFSRAIELRPNYPEAHSNSGNVLFAMGRREAAAAAYRRAVELRPSYGDAWHNFGLLHQHAGKVGEAIDCYRQALKFKPEEAGIACELAHQLQHECRWGDELTRLEKQVVAAVEADELDSLTTPIPPFAFICLPTPASPQLHLRCARQWAARLSREHGPANAAMARGPKFAGPTRAEDRKLVIGYLSADFHSHATAWLAAELFESHDRKQFSIHAYSYGPDETSAMRQRLVAAFDRFVDVREMSFDGAARAIEADGVDILVDLKGYTRDSRSEILARRPAPIQVNYLGYPGTMGADFIDYALVDEIIAPAAEQACYSERLVQLPGCYQVNDSRREVSSRPWTRQECGLPAEGVVLCCFNNSFKITPELFSVWMRLLRKHDEAVLWLLAGNPLAPENLRREAAERGVAPERIVFAPRAAFADHLARQRLADLFLDTTPVNAHTTASDALWVGLPVLTVAGSTFAGRVAGSLLHSLGLSELIATDLGDYERRADELIERREARSRLRSRLETLRTTARVFRGDLFARGVEAAYRRMWRLHVSGAGPQGFRVDEA